jgi:hypothetical protein
VRATMGLTGMAALLPDEGADKRPGAHGRVWTSARRGNVADGERVPDRAGVGWATRASRAERPSGSPKSARTWPASGPEKGATDHPPSSNFGGCRLPDARRGSIPPGARLAPDRPSQPVRSIYACVTGGLNDSRSGNDARADRRH